MLNWKHIGNYLGIDILSSSISEYTNDSIIDFPQGSIILIILKNEFVDNQLNMNFLLSVISSSPLGIVFWGKGDKLAWNKLLDMLSTYESKNHIMTYLAYGDSLLEAIEDTLISKYPAEELFDDWKNISILVIGNSYIDEIFSTVKILLERKREDW